MSHALATLLLDPRLRLTTAEALAMPAGDRFPIRVGRIHEWFLAGDFSTGGFWCPPLTVMAALACQATRSGAGLRRIAWIGRRCRPTFQLLAALGAGVPAGETLSRSVFLDPLNDAERFWALGQTLRCPGVGAVIADGSGMSPTVSRRLQLAAECGMVMALIARPPWEVGEASYAATRWQVRPGPAEGRILRWTIERLSCRGQQQGQDAPRYWTADWSYQVFRGTGIFHLSPDMGRGSAASQIEGSGRQGGQAVGGARGGEGVGEWGAEGGRRGRHGPGSRKRRAVLFFTTTGRQETVARCCGVAEKAGVRPGMAMAEARAMCHQARAVPFKPEQRRQALALLAKWCLRFSPVVAVDPTPAGDHPDGSPDGLLLDVTGVGHLFGGEHLLVHEVAARLSRLGLGARLAIAPTLGAAWALARFGPHPAAIVRDEQLREALEPLPIMALRLSILTCAGLHQVGIEQVRHLLKLSRESLLARFGEELLLRMDQAFGRSSELIEPVRVTEPLAVRRLFDGASTQIEAVMITVQDLLSELTRRLLEQESGVRGLRLELTRINTAPVSREFVLGAPSRDAKHLWGLVRPKVESMHLGYGVEGIALTAYWTEKIVHEQTGAWGIGESCDAHDREYEAFLDTLADRWGSGHVLAARAVASHVPEAARQFQSVREIDAAGAELLPVDRPSVLLDSPEAAEGMALQPDHPPSRIRWRGQEYLIDIGVGPERIVTAWWQAGNGISRASTRDYFKVRTADASWLWVFRELETRRWFVHGIWA